MNEDISSPHPAKRRSRWWLWSGIAGLVLLAIAALPAWRYYWHVEYWNHVRAISRNPRDSYHEPPPWSVLASVPQSFQPIVSRLRTVDLTSDDARPITADDLRRLNQIVWYRQFGLGVERLCLNSVLREAWDGLDGYQNLLYLNVRNSQLPADAGRRLSRLRVLNVLIVVGEPNHVPAFAQPRNRLPNSAIDQQRVAREIRESQERQRTGVNSLWEIPQLEELYLQTRNQLSLGGHDLRRLRELHEVKLQAAVPIEDILTLADLPALRMLDLSGLNFNWRRSTSDELAMWREAIAELRQRREDIDIVPPRLPTDEELKRWQTPHRPIRALRSERRYDPPPGVNVSPTIRSDGE